MRGLPTPATSRFAPDAVLPVRCATVRARRDTGMLFKKREGQMRTTSLVALLVLFACGDSDEPPQVNDRHECSVDEDCDPGEACVPFGFELITWICREP